MHGHIVICVLHFIAENIFFHAFVLGWSGNGLYIQGHFIQDAASGLFEHRAKDGNGENRGAGAIGLRGPLDAQ